LDHKQLTGCLLFIYFIIFYLFSLYDKTLQTL